MMLALVVLLALDTTAMERDILARVNEHRASRKMPLLRRHPRLIEIARMHCRAMAEGRIPVGHQGFSDRSAAMRRYIAITGAAENVGMNQGLANPAGEQVADWLKSPGHRRNIEGDFNLTGVCVAEGRGGELYFTELFAR